MNDEPVKVIKISKNNVKLNDKFYQGQQQSMANKENKEAPLKIKAGIINFAKKY